MGPTSQLLLALPVDPHCAPAEGLEPTVSYGPLEGGAQLYMLPHVTEQTRALPHVALMHDPTISAEGNRFLFTGFQPQGRVAQRGSYSEPCSPTRPSTSPAPHQALRQKPCPEVPISLSVLKPAVQTGLHPLWKVPLWVSESPSSRRSPLLEDLGHVALGLHVRFRETGALLHWIQGGTRPKRVASLYMLHRS